MLSPEVNVGEESYVQYTRESELLASAAFGRAFVPFQFYKYFYTPSQRRAQNIVEKAR